MITTPIIINTMIKVFVFTLETEPRYVEEYNYVALSPHKVF